jgi:hypothetical protein
MRVSLTVTGIEVELVVPDGPLEQVVASRYAGFLGARSAAVCTLEIEPDDGLEANRLPTTAFVERAGGTHFEVAQPAFTGFFELRGRGIIRSAIGPGNIDEALRTLFALLAPFQDGLLLRATGLIEGGEAHVLAGPGTATMSNFSGGPSLAPPGGYVMVRRVAEGWVASSTPFQKSSDKTALPREARLARFSVMASRPFIDSEESARIVEDSVALPSSDEETRRIVHHLTTALAASVSWSCFPVDSPPGAEQQVVSVPDPAEVAWQ